MSNERPATPQDVFTRLARRYDAINAVASLGLDNQWRKQAISRLPPEGIRVILDLCCGTGAMGTHLRRRYRQARIVGIDVNPAMLSVAVTKRNRVYNVTHQAPAEDLPLGDCSVDLVTICLGFHDLADQRAALAEIKRVLRPDGTLLLLELTLPDSVSGRRLYRSTLRAAMRIRNALGLRRLGHVMDEIATAPPHSFVWNALHESGFRVEQQRSHGGGLMTSYVGRLSAHPSKSTKENGEAEWVHGGT